MLAEKTLKPGELAPKTGYYLIVTRRETSFGLKVRVKKGMPLPPTPVRGQRYLLFEHTKTEAPPHQAPESQALDQLARLYAANQKLLREHPVLPAQIEEIDRAAAEDAMHEHQRNLQHAP